MPMHRQTGTALAMDQKGWAQPPEFFAARTKYLPGG
jgi:hypothetical protein